VKNSDIFVIYKTSAHPQVETSVQQVRYLFDDDPLVAEEDNSEQKFSTWYDAEEDFDAILQSVQNLAQAERSARQRCAAAWMPAPRSRRNRKGANR